jgi:hypothetical protein
VRSGRGCLRFMCCQMERRSDKNSARVLGGWRIGRREIACGKGWVGNVASVTQLRFFCTHLPPLHSSCRCAVVDSFTELFACRYLRTRRPSRKPSHSSTRELVEYYDHDTQATDGGFCISRSAFAKLRSVLAGCYGFMIFYTCSRSRWYMCPVFDGHTHEVQ